MATEYELLRAERERTLVDFLTAELAIGPTFVTMAWHARDDRNTSHFEQAKANAVSCVETVNRFFGDLIDLEARKKIEVELLELEQLIASLPEEAAQ